MPRRKSKKTPQVFSTSLMDILFSAFGSMYTLFVISVAMLSAVTIKMPVLLSAKIQPLSTQSLTDSLYLEYLNNSYISFGIHNSYISGITYSDNIIAHYGYLNSTYNELNRTSSIFIPSGLNFQNNNFQLFAENLHLPLKKYINKYSNNNVRLILDLFVKGTHYYSDTINFQTSIDSLYNNQLPSRKEPNLIPLFNFKVDKNDNNEIVFKKL